MQGPSHWVLLSELPDTMIQLFWNAVHAALGKMEQLFWLREMLLELHRNPRDCPCLTSFFIPSLQEG